jgi:hypothetical protein
MVRRQCCGVDKHRQFDGEVANLSGKGERMPVLPFPQTEPAWALRAYLVLIGCAYRAETISYGELAGAVDRGGPNLMAQPLDCLSRWCARMRQPQIASLVVEQATGLPAPGFNAVARSSISAEQEKVWAYDWFAQFPPSIEELGGQENGAGISEVGNSN